MIGWLALITITVAAQAANPPYLTEMPTAERVLREILGNNPTDTAVR